MSKTRDRCISTGYSAEQNLLAIQLGAAATRRVRAARNLFYTLES